MGVVSDGVHHLAASVASGDLPKGVAVLGAGNGDEGTAMLEIVHDLAPKAAEIEKQSPLFKCNGCDEDLAKALGHDWGRPDAERVHFGAEPPEQPVTITTHDQARLLATDAAHLAGLLPPGFADAAERYVELYRELLAAR